MRPENNLQKVNYPTLKVLGIDLGVDAAADSVRTELAKRFHFHCAASNTILNFDEMMDWWGVCWTWKL